MHLFRSKQPLEWGALDLPLLGISTDWEKKAIDSPAAWSLATDEERLWFIASHGKPAKLHPESRPGKFLPELWTYDVAELFLADPGSGRYLEINLAPNASWWSCDFAGPRQRASADGEAIPEVTTHAELDPGGGWVAAMSIPLDLLRARIDFGESTRANVCFILNSPNQRFLTASELGGEIPDFHQPERFPKLTFVDADLPGLPGRD
ncbi:hypothetical protein ACFQY0_09260 [Haloferula chungangensis]|uniref:Carbohydrate-binding domain-containing protein n=1 Tax=Haloferula chungangensis TaxID=1048331 RepID=A0ABW2L755_9BACT